MQSRPATLAPLFDLRAHHGEGPVWDPADRKFYWVDLLEGQFFRADWGTGVVETFVVGQPIGVLALRRGAGVVLALRDGFFTYDLHSRRLESIQPIEADRKETRFNDGAVDPRGRFWAATMSWEGKQPIGKMYCMDGKRQVATKIEGMQLSNGIAWSGAGDTFFHTDTLAQRIDRYDYDPESGAISNRSPFIDFAPDGHPDGITIDEQDHLWVAMWGGGCIAHYDERGRLVERLPLPVTYPTSCCFGGPELNELLVTSSRRELSPAQHAEEPLAGRCLRLPVNTKGRPQLRWAG
jgi:sugar lactone lactonase YvrE